MDSKIVKLTEEVGKQMEAGKKPTIINKFMKNFFFKAFKARREFKDVEKAIGTVETVTIIISKNKNILRAKNGDKQYDSPFTEEEMSKFLKSLNVKQSTVDACKSIFVMLNFKTQMFSIQQNKLDGTQTNINF